MKLAQSSWTSSRLPTVGIGERISCRVYFTAPSTPPFSLVTQVPRRSVRLVETPAGLDVYEIGEDYILGRATDDFDIEYVQMFQLTRFSS